MLRPDARDGDSFPAALAAVVVLVPMVYLLVRAIENPRRSAPSATLLESRGRSTIC